MKRSIQLVILILAIIVSGMRLLPTTIAQQPTKTAKRGVDFDREIRPLLSDNCFQCHGPDEQQRKARLRFDTKEGAFAKPGVIVPGKAAESRLFKRISATDAAMLMPPPQTGHKLTEQQITLFRRWIDGRRTMERALGFYRATTPRIASSQKHRLAA
jgi:hypothetical protein